ncbi:hypothetical protein O1M63_17720 [Streptomyces mirabilis]|nr:hypothetical protein [Streptomyces mirabilis]
MRDLINRLEVTDDATAGALRVIDHFDRLIEERASVAAVVRATAALAGAPPVCVMPAAGSSAATTPRGTCCRRRRAPLRHGW